MSLPPLCADCGDHHHPWQAHVFRKVTPAKPAPNPEPDLIATTRTSDRKKMFRTSGLKAVGQLPPGATSIVHKESCVDCIFKDQKIARLKSEIESLRSDVNAVNETPVNTDVNTLVNKQEDAVNKRKQYMREKMRQRRADEKERKLKLRE